MEMKTLQAIHPNHGKIKCTWILTLLFTSFSVFSWGQTNFTATYTFGADGGVSSFAYNGTTFDGISIGNMLKVGVTSTSSSGNFRASNWPLGATDGSNTFTGDIDVAKYFGFTVTAQPGYRFTITSITFGIGRSGTGTRQTQVRGSHDGFGSILNNYTTVSAGLTNNSGVLTNPDTDSSWTGNVLNVSPNYTNVTSSSEFRVYFYNAEAAGGTAGFQGPVTITGTFSPIPSITTNLTTFNGSFGSTAVDLASASSSFTVSASDLVNDVTVTAPEHFEVSLNNTTFSNSLILPRSGTQLAGQPVTVYARFRPTTAGLKTGTIILSTPLGINASVSVNGTGTGGVGTVFSENMGNATGTTAISGHTFQNSPNFVFTSGDIANPADVRNTDASSGYDGASGFGNVFFTTQNSVPRGFAIEGINALNFSNLEIRFGYRKMSNSELPQLSLDYWNGTQYVNVPFSFNEASNAPIGWYLTPWIALPPEAERHDLRLRWVSSGLVQVRIDDVVLRGLDTPSIPITYYNKPNSDVSMLSNWGQNTDGTGVAPISFARKQATFIVSNGNATISASTNISGPLSLLQIGDGVNASSLTVPSSASLNGHVLVKNQGSLELNNGNIPTLLTPEAQSTISFIGFSTLNLPSLAYGHLNLTNSSVANPSTLTDFIIRGNLVLTDNAQFQTPNYNLHLEGSQIQEVSSTNTLQFSSLLINNPSRVNIEATISLTANLTLTQGILNLNQSQINRTSSGGTFAMSSGTTLEVGGADNFPTNFNSVSMGSNSLVHYNGAMNQTIRRFSSPTYQNLTISGNGLKILGAGGNFTIQQNLNILNGATLRLSGVESESLRLSGTMTIASDGTFDSNGEGQIISAGGSPSIVVNGTFITKDAQGFTGANTTVPGITVSLNAGSTVVYDREGAQTVTTRTDYRNMRFAGSGIKSVGAINPNGMVTIAGSAIVDAGNSNFGDGNTSLTMLSGTRLRVEGSGTKPNIGGSYTLDAESTIEFAGAVSHSIRVAPTYGNVEISGTNITTAASGVTLKSGSTLTLKNGSSFLISNNENGLWGSTGTAFRTTNNPSLVIEPNATVVYSRDGDQTVSPLEYGNLSTSGTGNKSLGGDTQVRGTLNLIAANLALGSHSLNISGNMQHTTGAISATNTSTVVFGENDNLLTIPDAIFSSNSLGNLTINRSGGVVLDNQSLTINGNVNIQNGFLDIKNLSINGASNGGSFTVDNNAELRLSGSTFPTGYDTYTLNENSTIHFNGEDQTVSNLGFPYGNVRLSNQGIKTIENNTVIGRDLTLEGTASVAIPSGNTITVSRALHRLGSSSFTLESDAHLLQTNTSNLNTGSIISRRNATMKRLDIVLWSSPVTLQGIKAFSPNTLDNRFFIYNTSINNWEILQNSVTIATYQMQTAKGYGIRAPNNFSPTNDTFSGQFSGIPNNGDISIGITSSGQRFNLVGNPYPSALNLKELYFGNASHIENKFYFYEHTSPVPNTDSEHTNYGVLTIDTNPNTNNHTYVPATNTLSTPANVESGVSAQVGQGFFVRAIQNGNLQFNNTMRGNTQTPFFRMQQLTEDAPLNYFRLYSHTPLHAENQAVVGYYPNSTDDIDPMDTEGIGSPLYTMLGLNRFVIQGLGSPFQQNTVIPLGLRAGVSGVFKIGIKETSGIFEDQQFIFIHDSQSGVYHNISSSPYEIHLEPGVYENRFTLVFMAILSNNILERHSNQIQVLSNEETTWLKYMGTGNIKDLTIFDSHGRAVFQKKGIHTNHFDLSQVLNLNGMFIIRATIDNGEIHHTKFVK